MEKAATLRVAVEIGIIPVNTNWQEKVKPMPEPVEGIFMKDRVMCITEFEEYPRGKCLVLEVKGLSEDTHWYV